MPGPPAASKSPPPAAGRPTEASAPHPRGKGTDLVSRFPGTQKSKAKLLRPTTKGKGKRKLKSYKRPIRLVSVHPGAPDVRIPSAWAHVTRSRLPGGGFQRCIIKGSDPKGQKEISSRGDVVKGHVAKGSALSGTEAQCLMDVCQAWLKCSVVYVSFRTLGKTLGYSCTRSGS